MKCILSILGLLFSLSSTAIGQTEETYKVTYVDSVGNNYSAYAPQPLVETVVEGETYELRSRQGNILATVPVSPYMTIGVEHCLMMAMDVWEEQLNIKEPVRFKVTFNENMSPDVEIQTTVEYALDRNRNCAPLNLLNQIEFQRKDEVTTIDINAYVYWNSSWANELEFGYDNLTTALTRHLAHILGFGTSIVQSGTGINFANPNTASLFDNLIVNADNLSLGSLAGFGSSEAIEAFLVQDLYLNLPGGKQRLYSNSQGFVLYRSGCYFSLEKDNLMNYPYQDKTKLLPINPETLDALSAIGWEVKPHELSLDGSSLDTYGYGSVYQRHIFKASGQDGTPITNARWKYQLYNNHSGAYVDQTQGTGGSFTIPSILKGNEYLDKYQCQQGRVVCEANDGASVSYPVFLDAHPLVLGYQIANVQDAENPYYFSFDIILSYVGSDNGVLTVCNEGGAAMLFDIKGSGQTTIHVPNAFKYSQLWIDVSLDNNYGSGTKRFYYDYDSNLSKREIGIDFPDVQENVEIFTLHGVRLYGISSMDELPRGIYIIRKNDKLKGSKIYVVK
ncbi:hypothetical protein [Paraprevotella clara]